MEINDDPNDWKANKTKPGVSPASTAAKPTGQTALSDAQLDEALAKIASTKGGGGNYRVSIVDLLKLCGLGSDLAYRTKLAEKLKVNAGPHGSAEQNTALLKAVRAALAANGGAVPDSLKV